MALEYPIALVVSALAGAMVASSVHPQQSEENTYNKATTQEELRQLIPLALAFAGTMIPVLLQQYEYALIGLCLGTGFMGGSLLVTKCVESFANKKNTSPSK